MMISWGHRRNCHHLMTASTTKQLTDLLSEIFHKQKQTQKRERAAAVSQRAQIQAKGQHIIFQKVA